MISLKKFFKILGPGIVTGASDDDPSGIATYAQSGAQFGYSQLWTAFYMLPIQTAVQEACAKIGAVTGKGIATVIKEHYSHKVLLGVVMFFIIANIVNIGVDIGAMADATRLVIPLNYAILIFLFTAIILSLEIFISYRTYAKILKFLVLALLAYPVTVFIVREPWQQILAATFIPHIEFSFQFLLIITGVFGTTFSPYMFFWQASQEVEEEKLHHLLPAKGKLKINPSFIRNLKIDNVLGMFGSQMGTWMIIVTGATVLYSHGITNINSAADAAKAIEPIVRSFPNSGYLAKAIFATGIVGLGLLSIPIMAGSSAYAFAETFGWKEGLYRKLRRAHGFYGIITIATILGLAINFIGINPIKAQIYTSVLVGVAAVPVLFLIALIGKNKKIMGDYKINHAYFVIILITCLAMLGSVLGMAASLLH